MGKVSVREVFGALTGIFLFAGHFQNLPGLSRLSGEIHAPGKMLRHHAYSFHVFQGSFQHLGKLLQDLKAYAPPDISIQMVGNKTDMGPRTVKRRRAEVTNCI